MKRIAHALLALASGAVVAKADWPAKVFAPYEYVGSKDHFDVARSQGLIGQKHFTLAFIIAGRDGEPAWDGRVPTAQGGHAAEIGRLRSFGGDVIASFGGEAGREMALVVLDPRRLAAVYGSVIARYGFTWVDFDVEGSALRNRDANGRRNAALAAVQRRRPQLRVSFTLPVDPRGLSEDSLALLKDARAEGVRVEAVNLMIMDYGARFSRGKDLFELGKESALRAREQLRTIDPEQKFGLTPMIGRNDEKGEVFTLEDARRLRDWAQAQPWIRLLSFWSINRDAARPGNPTGNISTGLPNPPWAFTRIFQDYR